MGCLVADCRLVAPDEQSIEDVSHRQSARTAGRPDLFFARSDVESLGIDEARPLDDVVLACGDVVAHQHAEQL